MAAATTRRQLIQGLAQHRLRSLAAIGEHAKVELCRVEQVELRGRRGTRLEHRGGIGAVLLEQPEEEVATLLQLRQSRRIVLHLLRVVGREAGKFVEVGECGIQQLAPRRHGRIGALERGERPIGPCQRIEGTVIARSRRLADARGMAAQGARLRQQAHLAVQRFLFSGLELRAVNLRHDVPQIVGTPAHFVASPHEARFLSPESLGGRVGLHDRRAFALRAREIVEHIALRIRTQQ